MVISSYLNRLFSTELQELAQALGRYDLARVETEFDRYLAGAAQRKAKLKAAKKKKIGELATVLQRIAARKQKKKIGKLATVLQRIAARKQRQATD